MTPQESRENFIDSLFDEQALNLLKKSGMYQDYIEGEVSINTVCNLLKDQGV